MGQGRTEAQDRGGLCNTRGTYTPLLLKAGGAGVEWQGRGTEGERRKPQSPEGRMAPCSYPNVNLSTLLSISADWSSWASGCRMDTRTLLTVA